MQAKTGGLCDRLYDQSIRVPLIIYDPRLPKRQRGRVMKELVNSIDLPATFVDLAGVEVPEVYQGRSLVPLLQGKRVKNWREDIVCEHSFSEFQNWYAVRSERYKYTTYYQAIGGPHECVYDLKKDPTELVNEIANPKYADELKKLKERMNSYRAEYAPKPNKKNLAH